jgi:hypothetical protein
MTTLHTINCKEHRMKRGYVTGNKKERKGASEWYKKIKAANLKRIEQAWSRKPGK